MQLPNWLGMRRNSKKSQQLIAARRNRDRKRPGVEKLEDRSLLAANVFMNENWHVVTDAGTLGVLDSGDTVRNDNDTLNAGTVTKTYGVDGFGVATSGAVMGAHPSYDSIQDAIVAASVGGTVNVLDGTYDEDVNANVASVSLLGAGSVATTIRGLIGGDGTTVKVSASNVTVAGFTITRNGNNTTDWNNPGLNLAGIAVQGVAISGMVAHDNVLTGNRTGIDINNSNGHTIRNNRITDNRTGMIFRNQTDNLTVVENEITDNWTVGVLFLDASGGTNVPVQRALNSTFSNNNISGNWYGQIVDRQSGGAIPAPGTTNLKNFSANWLGTTTPVITTANSAEPGYAAQIPVAYGGTATPPGGQPDIAGSASANFDITPMLSFGTDTNVETTLGRGTFGFQGDFSNLTVTTQLAQTGSTGRIQEGINRVTVGGTVNVLAGTYNERLVMDKAGITVIGQGIDVTIVDYTGQTTGQGGVYITGNNSELRNLTVTHSSPNTASVPRYGIKADFVTGSSVTPVNGVVIDTVKVTNSFRTGLDLNGVTNITVNNLAAINNGGAGIFMTDVKGANLSTITTSGNPWVGVSIATFGQHFPLGTNGVVFSGTNSFGESATVNVSGQRNGGLQLEMGNFSSPANPQPITWSNQSGDGANVTIQSVDFGHMVSGHSFDNANVYRRFYQTLTQAKDAALDTPDHINAGSRYIQDADDSNDFGPGITQFYVYDSSPTKMTVQAAINAAVPGDVINVAAGTYEERLVMDKAGLKVIGQGIDVTYVDHTGTSGMFNSGVQLRADDVELRNLTVTGNPLSSAPRYGIKADFVEGSTTVPVDGVIVDTVKVTKSFRTGLDLNGVTNVTVNNLTSVDNGGAGIFMTDVKGAELSNITTSGNPWTGVSIATFGQFFPLGTSGIVFNGTNSFGESATPNGSGQLNGGLQLEMGSFSTPTSPELITWSNNAGDNADVTIQSADFAYMVSGHSFDNANVYRRFYQTLTQSKDAALDTPDHINAGSRYIQDADDSNDFGPGVTQFYVYDNPPTPNKMSIQGAIDAAVDGDVINIATGTYTGDANATAVGKGVTLSPGASPGQVTMTGNLTLDSDDTLAIEINGSNPATDFDNFVVNGAVTLGGATLDAIGTRTNNDGDVLVLINNDGADPVTGIFQGQPEGSTLVVNGVTYLISYKYNADTTSFGTGNDVALVDVLGSSILPVPGTAQISTDPCDPLQTVLVVSGTSLDDKIEIKLKDKSNLIEVKIENSSFKYSATFLSSDFDGIIVYGLDGKDHIELHDKVLHEAIVFGGLGDDRIKAGGGPSVLVGGDGDDHLHGGKGRDVLIGGDGADKIQGSGADDILIAGYTDYDEDVVALCDIADQWNSTPGYSARTTALSSVLNASTVHDDNDEDRLDGGSGMDWFFANLGGGTKDKIGGAKTGETVVEI
jgi:hypothetical protein